MCPCFDPSLMFEVILRTFCGLLLTFKKQNTEPNDI